MNTIIRQVLAFILSFALIFATTARANANTSVGGWSALDVITAGATNTINATKTAGGKALKSAVAVAPSAVKVGKHLIKGGGAAALLIAVPQLLGEGVDWVLDPANNRIKYTGVGSAPEGTYPESRYLYGYPPLVPYAYGSPTQVTQIACVALGATFVGMTASDYGECLMPNGSKKRIGSIGGMTNPNYDPNYKPDAPTEKHLPIDTVAAQVISNAEAGDPSSQEAVKATALEGFAAGEHDAALDAAATDAGTDAGTENPPDTENPPKDPDAPAEPFDPAGIISAINALKALLAGILSSITSLSDFFQSEPPPEPKPEDTALDIPVPDLPMPDTDINFGGSCPANFEFNGSIFGNPINIVLLDTSKFCGFLSTFVKFPVYAASSLFALYILGGRKDV